MTTDLVLNNPSEFLHDSLSDNMVRPDSRSDQHGALAHTYHESDSRVLNTRPQHFCHVGALLGD
jgi:hypothetical protein